MLISAEGGALPEERAGGGAMAEAGLGGGAVPEQQVWRRESALRAACGRGYARGAAAGEGGRGRGGGGRCRGGAPEGDTD